jgi:hypothetical protein
VGDDHEADEDNRLLMKRKIVAWCFCLLLAGAAALWVAFRPAVANRLGYALPAQNGLPCRIHIRGRDYENDEQCGGINRSAWAIWYDARHHSPAGETCVTTADLRKQAELPLHEVGSIWTLLGSAHPVLASRQVDLQKYTPTVLFVDGRACYRPYELLGGP